MRTAPALAAAAALAAAGCTSQWYPGLETRDVARTDLVIHTEPPGADIYLNGKKAAAQSPVRIPIEYDHVMTLYERQSNRFFVYHYREEMQRHEYGSNAYVVTAYLPGYDEAERKVTLQGEGEVSVTIPLQKSK